MLNRKSIRKKPFRKMDILKEKGFDFGFDPRACKNCPGYCCTAEPGNIWVNNSHSAPCDSWF